MIKFFKRSTPITTPPQTTPFKTKPTTFLIMALEPRIMFDGALVATATEAAAQIHTSDTLNHPLATMVDHTHPVAAAVEIRAADPSKDNGKKEVVFVDNSVTDYKTLEASIRSGIEIQEIDHSQSGLAQIAKWAENHSGYDAIHILSHGSDATLFLGSDAITTQTLSNTTVQIELTALGHTLNTGGDILIYGCDIARGSAGMEWLTKFAQDTGADVAASTDNTGAIKLGGNWILEKQQGQINTDSPFDSHAILSYSNLLATFDLTGASGSGTQTVEQTIGSDVMVLTTTDDVMVVDSDTTVWGGGINDTSGTVMAVASGVGYESALRISVAGGKIFDLSSFTLVDIAGENKDLTITTDKGSSTLTSNFSSLSWSVSLASATFQGISYADITTNHVSNQFAWGFDNFVLNNITLPPPTVTDAKISLTSTGSGTGGAYKTGDTVTASWNNTGSGDNNAGLTGVTMDFSQFGGGAAVVASNSSGTWTASYTIVSGAIDTSSRNVSVSATNAIGTTTRADTTNVTVDNIAPTVADANISISGASGTGGAYKIGDTVTATWNNTAGGDNNTDTISGVTMNFSQFGGGAAVSASNSSGTWTATYTITSGAVDNTSRNISVTATDNAGNTTTRADTTNATVDNIAPTITDARISLSGASGTGGAYKIGDTVTATWNNTAGGDNNTDTISGVTMDFSQFGGGSAVAASNSSGTWTATYTITSGAVDTTSRNVSVTATDNAGNTTTRADTTNATVDNIAPTVTDARISISGASGTGGAYKIGDTVTATWNNTAGGDNNTDTISGVTMDFSQFGGGSAVAASNSSGTWTATYTITSGVVDTTSRNVSVTATDNAGNTTTSADTTNATVDNIAPTVTDARISLSGASGTGGAYKIGDTVTATWNNTAGGDNNTDTISGVTMDFSQFGGGSAVAASNSSGTWTATYTIIAGAIDGTNRNVSVTATDNAGNTITTANTTNATVDNVIPTITFSNVAFSNDTGSSNSDFITNTAAQTISATLSSALGGTDIVYGSQDNGATWTDITNKVSGTTLTWNGVTLASSSTLKFKVTDIVGNDGTVMDQAYTLDTSAPTTTIATTAFSADTGLSSTDFITKTAAQTISGTTSANIVSGELVEVSIDNGSTWNTATTSVGQNTWSLAGQTLTSSDTLKVRVVDMAGNAGTVTSQAYVLDTTAPTTLITAAHFSADTGVSNTDFITKTAAQTISGTTSANIVSGELVEVSIDNGSTWSTATTSIGQNTWSLAGQTLTSSDTLKVRVVDTAGNAGTLTSQAYVLDTTAPTTLITAANFSADTGVSNTDFITKTAAQTISGTTNINISSGELVEVSIDNGSTWNTATTSVGQNTWSLAGQTLTSSDTLKVRVVDTAGNAGTLTSQAYVLDTTAPSAPSTPDMTAGTDSGTSNTDNFTNSTTPLFTGTAVANTSISLYDTDGTTVLGTSTADGFGNWSITSSMLTAGAHSITAKATDTAGNTSSASAELNITIDTTAPTLTITSNVTTLKSGETADITFTFTEDPGSTFTWDGTAGDVVVSGGTLNAISGSGLTRIATFTPTPNTNGGTTSITVAASAYTDTAGNNGGAGTTPTLSFDTLTPSAPSTPDMTSGTDTGSSSTDNLTHNTTPTFTGTAESGSIVTLYDSDGTTVLGTGTATGGNWSITSSTLTSGAHTITAKVTDGFENVSSASSGLSVTIDTSVPTAPTTPDMTSGTDTGISSTDHLTHNTTPTFTGTAENGSTVTLYDTDGTTVLGTDTATGGNWSITSSTLTSGAHSITAKTTDAAGNVSSASSELIVTIDTNAPTLVITSNVATLKGGETAIITFTFTEDPGSTFTWDGTSGDVIVSGGTLSAITGSGLTRNATFTPTVGTNVGNANITVTASSYTDAAGNVGNAGTTPTLSFDTLAPSAPSTPDMTVGSDTGTSNTDNITHNTTPTFTGTTESGSIVTLYDSDGTTILGTSTAPEGNWSITSSTLTSGSHTITAKATDAAGNVSSASTELNVTIDTTAPTLTITSNVAILKSDETATITFTFSEDPGSTFLWNDTSGDVVVSGGTLGAITGSGLTRTATFTPTVGTNAGTASITVAASSYTDSAGNNGTAGTATSLTFDTLAPSAPSIPDMTTGTDTGISTSDNLTKNTTPTFTGTAENGATVTLYDTDGTTILGTSTAIEGNWSITSSTLTSGTHTITAKATDVAGNVSSASAGLSVTLVTTAPATTTPDMTSGTDTGTSSTDNLTQNTTPTFTSTAEDGSTVTLYDTDGTTVLGTSTVTEGNWSITSSTLTSGTHTLTTKSTDAVGNVSSASTGLNVTIDTTAPTLTITSNVATLKSGETATITFTFSEEPGSTFLWNGTSGDVIVSGGTLSTITGSGLTRIATFTPTPNINIGTASIAVAASSYTDSAGNNGTAGTATSLTFDTLAPSAPSIPDMTTGTDTGISTTDNLTNNTTPTFTGTAESGSTVTLYDTNGTTVLGTSIATAGNWSITSSTLTTGSHTITVKATDIAGNISSASTELNLTIDTTAPAAPTTPDMSSSTDTGASSTDNLTKNTTPTFTSTAENGATVTLYDTDGTTILGTGIAIEGNWSITSSTLSAGDHTITAKATDVAGNLSTASSSLAVHIDTSSPSITSISRLDSENTQGGTLRYRVTVSEDVTGISSTAFVLSQSGLLNAAIRSISAVDAHTYDVTVDVNGTGKLRLDLADTANTINDTAGNLLQTSFNTGESYTVKPLPLITPPPAIILLPIDPIPTPPPSLPISLPIVSASPTSSGDVPLTIQGTDNHQGLVILPSSRPGDVPGTSNSHSIHSVLNEPTTTLSNTTPLDLHTTPLSSVPTSDNHSYLGLGSGSSGSGLQSIPDIGNFVSLPGQSFSIALPASTFTHSETNVQVTIQARLSNGQPLPSWMKYDPIRGVISGIPPEGFSKELSIEITARDSRGRQASTHMDISIRNNNAQQPHSELLHDHTHRAMLKTKPGLTQQFTRFGKAARDAEQHAFIEQLRV